jgi:hypothetical protein
MADEFKALNTELNRPFGGFFVCAYRVDCAIIQELEWTGMKKVEVKFPLIEDIRMDVANKYGMIQPDSPIPRRSGRCLSLIPRRSFGRFCTILLHGQKL